MKKILLGLAMSALVVGIMAPAAEAYVNVSGYYRSNGTYVAPYVRSSPNALKYDNYGYTGGSLYNPSYYSPTYNYSASWYTPSYITDSDYYTGLSLYQSGSYYPSYYNSYSYPSYSYGSLYGY